MPKGIPCLTEIQKQEIIKRVTDKGERAVDLAKEFKVNPKIIYSLLKTKVSQHQAIKKAQVSKSVACAKVGVSRNSLYYKPKLPAKDLILKQQIEAVLIEHKSYGHRRVAIALGINKKRVSRVMKLFNIKCKKSRKKPRFKKDKFQKNSAKTLILETVINKPNQVWVSDFTYISYQNKFMYLATILDSFTREVIAWNISSRHNKELITETLLNAINKREK